MKVFKKSLALLLAALMVLGGMAVAASAEDAPITVHFYAELDGLGGYLGAGEDTYDDFNIGDDIVPTVVSRPGYTLIGWKSEGGSLRTGASLGKATTSTHCFYAVFEANNYTVTFDANGGTFGSAATATKSVAFDSEITADDITAPTKAMNAFVGWSRKQSATDKDATLGTMDSTAGVTLYAVWGVSESGDSTTYTFDPATGTLTFTGSGSIEKQAEWAANAALIKKIVIDGDSRIYVEDSAFEKLTALEQVLTYCEVDFGDNAFSGCANLSRINTAKKAGTEVSGDIVGIGAYTFRDCVSFRGVNGDGVDLTRYTAGEISRMEGAFYGCASLKKITFDTDVTEIPAYMFCGCSTLSIINETAAASMFFPASVRKIGDSAFEDCTALENVTLGQNIQSLGKNAFAGCTALKSINTYAAELGEGTFEGCKALTKFEFTALPTIPAKCFKDCTALTAFDCSKVDGNAETSASEIEIGESAFEGCTALSSFTFDSKKEASVLIDKYAFLGCTALAEIAIPDGAKVAVGEMGLGYASKGVKAIFSGTNMTIICDAANNMENCETGFTGIYDYAAGFNRVTDTAQKVNALMPVLKKIATFFANMIPGLVSIFNKLLEFVKNLISSAT